MKLILVCGPFGSGTTAVAGLLARLGATGFGPYFQPPDPLTANSHELVAFRDLLRSVTSERTLTLTAAGEVTTALEHFRNRIIRQEFGAYDEKSATPIFLKHPLAALIIPQICAAFDTRLVYLTRPLRDIETSRQRRKWDAQYGAKGAGIIYSQMFNALINHTFPTTLVRYAELIQRPLDHARGLASFAGLNSSADACAKRPCSFAAGHHECWRAEEACRLLCRSRIALRSIRATLAEQQAAWIERQRNPGLPSNLGASPGFHRACHRAGRESRCARAMGSPTSGRTRWFNPGYACCSRFRYRGVIGDISNIAHCAICNIEVKRMKYQTTILPLRQTLCLSNCERMVAAI